MPHRTNQDQQDRVKSSNKPWSTGGGMATHSSILATRTSWTVWKGKKMWHQKISPPGQKVSKEAEVDQLYENLKDLLELTPKKYVLFIIGDRDAKVGNQEIPRITGKFGVKSTKWNTPKANRVLSKEHAGLVIALFSNNPRDDSTQISPYGQYWNQVAQMVKKLSAMWKTWARFPGLARSPGEGNGNPLQPGEFHGQRSLVS